MRSPSVLSRLSSTSLVVRIMTSIARCLFSRAFSTPTRAHGGSNLFAARRRSVDVRESSRVASLRAVVAPRAPLPRVQPPPEHEPLPLVQHGEVPARGGGRLVVAGHELAGGRHAGERAGDCRFAFAAMSPSPCVNSPSSSSSGTNSSSLPALIGALIGGGRFACGFGGVFLAPIGGRPALVERGDARLGGGMLAALDDGGAAREGGPEPAPA